MGTKIASFILNRIKSILTERNFKHFIDIFSHFRGGAHRVFEKVAKDIDQLWLQYWDGTLLPTMQTRQIIHGYFILCQGRLKNTQFVIESLPMLNRGLCLKMLVSANERSRFRFDPFMLKYTHHRQILFVNNVILNI